MPKVIVCSGRDTEKQINWALKQSSLMIDTKIIREMLGNCTDKLVLAIRDNTMIKCLRSGRNVILIGEHNLIEQLERIDNVLDMQGQLDGVKYPWKKKDF